MRNTVDLTGGKPIASRLQSIPGVSAVIPFFFNTYTFFNSIIDTLREK
jgi:hypothetical protein